MKFHVWIVIKKHVDETFRDINKRIYDQRRRFKKAGINNSLIKYNLETNRTLVLKITRC